MSVIGESELPSEGPGSPMRTFYRDKVVFLTGGTGFVGLILLEKLLRVEVSKVFLFLRTKKGKTLAERVDDIFNEPIFVNIRRNLPHYLGKVSVVEGDLAHPNLGMNPEAVATVVNETELVIHSAANVRFDETLKDAVDTNVRGTLELLLLAESMPKLLTFMYMSTAYANCPEKRIKERIYATPFDPFAIIKFAESIRPEDADAIDYLTEKIVHPWPNTYAFTKALAEELMRLYAEKLPIVIVRPSIITATYEEPIPGWTNNVMGINGVFAGIGFGILRILHIDNKKKADIIPADIVVNSSLAVIWHNVERGGTQCRPVAEAPVYNCVNFVDNPVNWGQVRAASLPLAKKYASTKILWIGIYNTTRSYWIYYVLRIFYHIIPAFIFDAILKVQGKKPRVVDIYKKLHKFSKAIGYFTNNEWEFENDNMRMVLDSMHPMDQKLFLSDMKLLQWSEMFEIFCAGVRVYIAKDAMETLPEGKRYYKKVEVIHYIMLLLIYSFLGYSTYLILNFYGLLSRFEAVKDPGF